jgi:hypothetical protein
VWFGEIPHTSSLPIGDEVCGQQEIPPRHCPLVTKCVVWGDSTHIVTAHFSVTGDGACGTGRLASGVQGLP